jgi:2-hydroxymuconate-semialdehyde hydrolase
LSATGGVPPAAGPNAPSAPCSAEGAFDVGGFSVWARDVGSGPPVLLLHGSGPGTTGASAWRTVVPALAGRHRLVVPDHAGFGATPIPAGMRGRLETWTAQAAGLMDVLRIEKYAVMGHSMGAAVALSLAAARPDAVTRVVGVAAMGARMPLPPALDALWAARPGRDEARDLLRLLFFGPGLVTEAAVDARYDAMLAGEAAFAPLFPPPRDRWVEDISLSRDQLAGISAPVLLVHGAQDRITPLRDAALALLEQLPDVRLHVFGRCGHVPAVEHVEEFNRLVADFLAAEVVTPDR